MLSLVPSFYSKSSCKHEASLTTGAAVIATVQAHQQAHLQAYLSQLFPITHYWEALIKATWVSGAPSVRQLFYKPENQIPDPQHAPKG